MYHNENMTKNRMDSPSNSTLNGSELIFNMVFNQQFQFMAILSPEGKVVEVNDFVLKSQGVNRDDYVGKFFWKSPAWINFPEWEGIWKQRLAEASSQEGPVVTEDIFQINDGSVRYADATTTAIYNPSDGQLSGFIIQAIDTTKRRNLNNQVQESESLLKLVLELCHIGNWELNINDRTSTRSLRHDQIFGYDSLQPDWTYESFLEHVIPEDRIAVDKSFQDAINYQTELHVECQILRTDGQVRWIIISGGHEFNLGGEDYLMAGIVQDVTELKQAELNKAHHSAELESIFKALPDIYFRMKHDGTILDYQTQNMNELLKKPKEFLGKRMQDILPKDIGKLFQSKIIEIAKVDHTLAFKYKLQLNNELLHFEARLNRIAINNQLICVIRNVTDEFKSRESLAVSEQRFRTIFEQAAIGVALLSSNSGKFIRVNQRFCDMLGYSVEEMSNGKTFKDIMHPDDLKKNFNYLDKVLVGQKLNKTLDKRYIHKKGHIVWVEVTLSPSSKTGKWSQPIIAVVQDISERKKAEDKVKLAANVFTYAGEGIMITDAKGVIIDVNDTFISTTGYSRDEAIGQNSRFLHSGRQSPSFYVDLWQELLEKEIWSGEVINRRKNGEIYPEMLNISSVKDENGKVSNYVGLFTDITLMKEQQSQLERIAHYDLLTNLPNRSLLADRLSQAMLQCSRHDLLLAVVFLDLDGFKAINDTHGHDIGDKLLIALSTRMKNALREGDSLARIGGDEFVAVLPDLVKVEDCKSVLDRLLLAVSQPITIDDVVLNISTSIGATLYPDDNVDADQLMRHADQAMYAAKESGKNCYHLFDTVQDGALKVQRESLEAIRSALDNHEFILHYQPKVNMRTGTVTGVEALIRWKHPERGLLNPIDFLPVIENNPMSIEVGEWVIDSALTQISQWQKMEDSKSITTSVNISAVQLQQPDFTERLSRLLSAHPDVAPCHLELEVLETSALEDVNRVSATMKDCMDRGVKFALDDFGTGYSSLTYLRRLPANLIKIDQSFVRDMLHNADDLAIVEGVITLAKLFKRDVIAEGVETIEHGIALLDLGCDLAQGYGIAKPMPACDIQAWIKDWQPDVRW